MKKLINEVSDVVMEMCHGILWTYPDALELNEKYRIISRKNKRQDKVALISGGGSGHEPAHAGYVGAGMLDAAVCGDVFASPSAVQVYNAIVDCQTDKGTLLIVKNYSGDLMNFDSAAEMAEEDDDIEVAQVFVNDDIAVQDSLYTQGRRGVAGTVFVHKITGAYAETGADLREVKRVAQKVINNVRSLGFAFSSCTVPAKGTPTFELLESEMEYGIGIHGEPGIERRPIMKAQELAEDMISKLLNDLPFVAGDEVALMVNGMGATPLMELYAFNSCIQPLLKQEGIHVYKTFVGNYMTSIDMAGASITLLKLDEELKTLLDAPCAAPGFLI